MITHAIQLAKTYITSLFGNIKLAHAKKREGKKHKKMLKVNHYLPVCNLPQDNIIN